MTHVTSLMHYLPTKPTVIAQYLKGGPEYTGFRQRDCDGLVTDDPIRRQLPEGVAGALDRDPGRDHRHVVGQFRATQAQFTISSIPQVKGS